MMFSIDYTVKLDWINSREIQLEQYACLTFDKVPSIWISDPSMGRHLQKRFMNEDRSDPISFFSGCDHKNQRILTEHFKFGNVAETYCVMNFFHYVGYMLGAHNHSRIIRVIRNRHLEESWFNYVVLSPR